MRSAMLRSRALDLLVWAAVLTACFVHVSLAGKSGATRPRLLQHLPPLVHLKLRRIAYVICSQIFNLLRIARWKQFPSARFAMSIFAPDVECSRTQVYFGYCDQGGVTLCLSFAQRIGSRGDGT